ncbi:MAG: DUF484 family protein [Alphaproteobacteria bacterium]
MSKEKGPITRTVADNGDAGRPEPDEAAVASFLRRHPDFLARHSGLLRVLTPPSYSSGNNIYDFQSFMIERLRADLDGVQADNRDLVITSRDNLAGQRRVHDAALALLGANEFQQLVHVATTDLAVILDLDVVTLCVEVAETALPHAVAGGVFALQPGAVDELIGMGRDIVLTRNRPGERALFGSATGLVRSSALLRLKFGTHAPVGILALGSRRDEMFHPGQGTELLCFLARVLELCVRAWLDLPD